MTADNACSQLALLLLYLVGGIVFTALAVAMMFWIPLLPAHWFWGLVVIDVFFATIGLVSLGVIVDFAINS